MLTNAVNGVFIEGMITKTTAAAEPVKALNIGDKIRIADVDGKVKEFYVASVNRVTYTIIHEWVSAKWGHQSISRSLRKDNWKLTK